jgi:TctA family transporter
MFLSDCCAELLHAMRSRDEATSSVAATEAAESRQAACALLAYMFALGVGCPAEAAAAYQRARRLMLNGSRVSCALLRERERVHATVLAFINALHAVCTVYLIVN